MYKMLNTKERLRGNRHKTINRIIRESVALKNKEKTRVGITECEGDPLGTVQKIKIWHADKECIYKTVNVLENEHDDLSSNPDQTVYISRCADTLAIGMDSIILPPSIDK